MDLCSLLVKSKDNYNISEENINLLNDYIKALNDEIDTLTLMINSSEVNLYTHIAQESGVI